MRYDRGMQALVGLIAIALLRGLLYSAINPPWQGPDEPKHFEYVWLLYQKRSFVSIEDALPSMQQSIIDSMDRYEFSKFGSGSFDSDNLPRSFKQIWGAGGAFTLLHRPPLYYLLNLPIFSLVDRQDIATRLYTLRLFSVILFALTTVTTFLTARELFPKDEFMYIGATSLVAFLPMLGFLFGTLSYDHLANLLVSLIWYLLVIFFKRGGSWGQVLGIAVLVGGITVTKRTTLSVLPVLLLAVPLYLWQARRRHLISRHALLALTIVIGVVLLGCSTIVGWTLIGGKNSVVLPPGLARYFFNYSGQLGGIVEGLSSIELATIGHWTRRLFISFWADFGWLKIQLAPMWYTILAIVCTASVGGLFLSALRSVRGSDSSELWKQQILVLFGLYIIVIVVAAMVFFSAYVGTQWERAPQGRHLFLGIVPFAILFMLGLRELVPVHRRRWSLLLVVAASIAFDLLCVGRYIIPFFYS